MRDGEWRQALKRGKCPLGGCNLAKSTCVHLDNYLSEAHKQSVAAVRFPHMDRLPIVPSEPSPSSDKFRELLMQYELTARQRQILIHRFIYNDSFDEIAEEMGFATVEVAHRYFTRTLSELKSQNFSLESL